MDPTENDRRVLQAHDNALRDDEIEGPRWNTEELQIDFEVIGFAAPFCVVRRKADGVKGSLRFRHHPRVYFDFQPTKIP